MLHEFEIQVTYRENQGEIPDKAIEYPVASDHDEAIELLRLIYVEKGMKVIDYRFLGAKRVE